MEAEIAFLQPQAKEPLETVEAGRGKEGVFPRAYGDCMALPMPSFWAHPPELLENEFL